MSIGVYNQKCEWQKKATTKNKLNEIVVVEPKTLPCSRSIERVFVRDEKGERIIYKTVYHFTTTEVKEGDILDGYIVTATSEGLDITGNLVTYKVVVDND